MQSLPAIDLRKKEQDGTAREYEGQKVDMNMAPVNAAANIGMQATGMSSNPAISSAVNSLTSGADPETLGTSAFSAVMQSGLAQAYNSILGGLPMAPQMATSLSMEATKAKPNYSKTAVNTGIQMLTSLLGNLALPGYGGVIAGGLAKYFSEKSFKHGFLGDMTDSRSREKQRDSIEDAYGVNVDDTAEMASGQSRLDRMNMESTGFVPSSEKIDDKLGVGLQSNYDTTTAGQLEKSAQEAFSNPSGLKGYFDKVSQEFSFEDPEKEKDKGQGQEGGNREGNLGEAEGSHDDRGDHGGGGWI